MMKYLKVWTNFREVLSNLADDEKGRLFEMMLDYAEEGQEPDSFPGNEKYIWPVAKRDIDQLAGFSHKQRENGEKGGRPKSESVREKPSETQINPNEPSETQTNPNEPNESQKTLKENKIKEIERKRNNIDLVERFTKFYAAYPRHEGKADAQKAFGKIAPDEELLGIMLQAIETQKTSSQWQDSRYIPLPASWLNGKRWEDEVQTRPSVKALNAHNYDQRDYTQVQQDFENSQRKRIESRLRNGP